jgi:mannose-1-phosphate guanylyltransferase
MGFKTENRFGFLTDFKETVVGTRQVPEISPQPDYKKSSCSIERMRKNVYYAVIMAGGTGTRLWPLSRQNMPKQALRLIGERTLLQHAVDRVMPLFGAKHIIVSTRAEYVDILQSQVPELSQENFIVEPSGRGTAPAIGLAAVHIRKRNPHAVMAVLTADHFIGKIDRFLTALIAAHQWARDGRLITMGITPLSASTGFGYIEQGESLGASHGLSAYSVERFVEKPDVVNATRMKESGDYCWNSGMFIWSVQRILDEFKRQMPACFKQLERIDAAIGMPDYTPRLTEIWPSIEKQTIDYGIMEGAHNVAVVPVDIGWIDVGSWSSLFQMLPADSCGNVSVGPSLTVDTHDTLTFGKKKLIAAIGVHDLIIVDTDDALLICPKNREQEVREIVRLLEESGQTAWL